MSFLVADGKFRPQGLCVFALNTYAALLVCWVEALVLNLLLTNCIAQPQR